MAKENLYIEGVYIPLSAGLNPSITKSITDLEEPQTRKATFSKTVSVPRSKEADAIFSHIFEINAINLTFNVNAKADVRYEVDHIPIIEGYLKLNSIKVVDNNDIVYECTMYNMAADFFATIKDLYLTDLDLSAYDHQLTKEIQQYSWATQVWKNGAFIPFAYGTGYVYPLIDYGYATDLQNWIFTNIGCSIYAREYMTRIISEAGFTYTSTFLDGTFFKHLIVPSSPECYQLTAAEIEDREFSANTPKFVSTGTTTSGNLNLNSMGALDQIRFTVESFDTGGNYDPATGIFTVVNTGMYDLNALIDINATFTPSTGAAVKTQCEIDGIIEMQLNGTAIGQLPFYITYDDSGGFVSGARSTNTTPTYPNTSYLDDKHFSIYPNDTSLTGRLEAVPDRYHLPVNGMTLYAGDEIKVYVKAGLFHKGSIFGYDTNFFYDTFGNEYSGNATLSISVGAFYDKVCNTTLQEGNTLYMSSVIPKQVKQTDFFTSILKMFNLWIDIDPNNPQNLLIETRDTFLGSTVLNIHELIDRSKDIEYIPMGAIDCKKYLYKYKDDGDYWNVKYKNSWQETYGNREVLVDNEFMTADKATEVIFSPTPSVAQPNTDFVLPTIKQFNDNGDPIGVKSNIRILYYAGLKTTSTAWNHINYILGWPPLPLVDTFTTYPYAGHWDDAFSPTLDLNWGLVKEVYYDDNLHTITYTDNNLVNAYHAKYLREITDPDSKIVKAWVHMTPIKFNQFTFSKLYYWDYAYFRLQKIEGYNPTSEETTECTFLKIKSAGSFTATPAAATGAFQPIDPNQSGGNVIMTERTPSKGVKSFSQPDQNNYTTKSVYLNGANNLVGAKSQYININGNSNRVFAECKNISITGSENIIEAGLSNVTLINTNGVTVTESNVVYSNGVNITNQTSEFYDALLSQSGGSAPTAEESVSNTIASITWTRNAAGDYNGNLTGAFPDSTNGQTFILIGQSNNACWSSAYRIDDDNIGIGTGIIGGAQSDGILQSTTIKIWVQRI